MSWVMWGSVSYLPSPTLSALTPLAYTPLLTRTPTELRCPLCKALALREYTKATCAGVDWCWEFSGKGDLTDVKPREAGEAAASTGLRKLMCSSHISSPRASGSPSCPVGTGQSKPSLMLARDRPSMKTGHTSCLSVPGKLIRQWQDVDTLATLPIALKVLGKHSARAPPQALGWYFSTHVFELH